MTTFLIIGAVGVALLLAALVIGDVLDGLLGSAEGVFDSDVFSTAGLAGLVGASASAAPSAWARAASCRSAS